MLPLEAARSTADGERAHTHLQQVNLLANSCYSDMATRDLLARMMHSLPGGPTRQTAAFHSDEWDPARRMLALFGILNFGCSNCIYMHRCPTHNLRSRCCLSIGPECFYLDKQKNPI